MPLQHASTAVADVPNDGVIAPGDVLTIREALKNTGGSTLTGLSGTLTSSTPGVTVTQGASSYPDIVAGATIEHILSMTAGHEPRSYTREQHHAWLLRRRAAP